MGVVKRVLAFNSLCRVGTGVTKHVLAFGSLCVTRTGVAKRVLRAAGSNLQMVRPSLMLVVKLSIICARSALQNFVFLASASNWELPLLCCLSLAVLNVSLMRAHVRTYLPNFTTVQRPHKSRTHNLCLHFG